MPKKVKIPKYAKSQARKGLQERKRNRAGLEKKEADKLGIASGVERAKQIINSKYIKEQDAKRIARFYNRFKNKTSSKSETALKLWGGRRFGQLLNKIYYSK